MNSPDQYLLMVASLDKFRNAIELVKASLGKLSPYDAEHDYTADEREPYDALCDRFVRAVEVGLKFFRSFERYQFGEDSETLRDLLNRMEKLEIISSVEQWFAGCCGIWKDSQPQPFRVRAGPAGRTPNC